MTISEQLQSIISSKQSIKTAIEAKGVSVGDIPFAQYADKILSIGNLESENKLENLLEVDTNPDIEENI